MNDVIIDVNTKTGFANLRKFDNIIGNQYQNLQNKLMSDVETVKEKLEIRKEINNLGEEIKSISFDIDMLEMIKSRTENIKEEIQKLEDKEMMKDERLSGMFLCLSEG